LNNPAVCRRAATIKTTQRRSRRDSAQIKLTGEIKRREVMSPSHETIQPWRSFVSFDSRLDPHPTESPFPVYEKGLCETILN